MESLSATSLLAIVAVDLETSVTLVLLLKNWSHSPTTLVPLVLQQLKEMVLWQLRVSWQRKIVSNILCEVTAHNYATLHVYIEPDTAPQNLNVSLKGSIFVRFVWSYPVKPNGIIIEYQLQCSDGKQVSRLNATGSLTTTTLSGLLPYTNYSCSITAHTSVGGGPAANISVTTEKYSKACSTPKNCESCMRLV